MKFRRYWRSWTFSLGTAFFYLFVIETPGSGWMPWLEVLALTVGVFFWGGIFMILYEIDRRDAGDEPIIQNKGEDE